MKLLKKIDIVCIILGLEFLIITDFILASWNVRIPAFLFVGILVVYWLILHGIFRHRGIFRYVLTLGIPCILGGAAILYVVLSLALKDDLQYMDVDHGKAGLYGNRTVMLIVPHEDDDLNLASGILNQFVKYGSEVYIVFMTNGDYKDMGQIRLQEALDLYSNMRIPEDHVIFLGYGDQWNPDSCHIYNAEPDQSMISAVGYTETYGTENHPAYHDGTEYTRNHLLQDMEDVILEHRPDLILCNDYDEHIDHRATSLFFENAMGEILRTVEDYHPLVFKGFAYDAAWHAEDDYYRRNILSTQNFLKGEYYHVMGIYPWEDRVRLPVGAEIFSRTLMQSEAYKELTFYESQEADRQASRIVNGDRVYWLRRTDSILYTADIQASSGDAKVLNDFKQLDTEAIDNIEHLPLDGTWIPEAGDEERTVRVTLPEGRRMDYLLLYDNPSPEDNILEALLTMEDGTCIYTGPWNPGGVPTKISLDHKFVGSFTLTLLESEGTHAGITELEGYASDSEGYMSDSEGYELDPEGYVSDSEGYVPDTEGPLYFVKMMDSEDNFIYDYLLDSDQAEFRIYAYGEKCSGMEYDVQTDNPACRVKMEVDRIQIDCPRGEQGLVTLVDRKSRECMDTIRVSNPGTWRRMGIHVACRIDQFCFAQHYNKTIQKMESYRRIIKIRNKIGSVIHR